MLQSTHFQIRIAIFQMRTLLLNIYKCMLDLISSSEWRIVRAFLKLPTFIGMTDNEKLLFYQATKSNKVYPLSTT